MIIIPAIDLKDGKCVRLIQGDFGQSTIYSDNPLAVARKWQQKGAERIHVVDLDGSRTGSPKHMKIIGEIIEKTDVEVQVGGGIRDRKTVEEYLRIGVSNVILGTIALRKRDFVLDLCNDFRGKIILGIDARDNKVAIEGWLEKTVESPADIAKYYEGRGLDAIVFTDISRDGMEMGINVESTKELAESVDIPIIASGGVAGMKDIDMLLAVESSGIKGVIVGKALYSGAIMLEEAIKRASGK
ncbi:MAG: 1-(5-phosphoribosyl)-5-[(5-phosphoribosylamino)methylideneamino]imidazole-4-carboxamide isomerase [Deltaproteobacteria bacterium]|nr:1-(5-phosphoribosyl)-5-[(5-phosphoribosylamino)methylideneamino]imidazole-4-carboxamide isomerase [Deltaproteobacteria bacterium]